METIIIQVEGKTSESVKAFLKKMNIKFKTQTEESYDPVFVSKVLATKNEKSTRVNPHNIWESIL